MSNDPNLDDRVYCARCLHLLNPDTDYPEPDEAVACPYCRASLLVGIRHDQMRTERRDPPRPDRITVSERYGRPITRESIEDEMRRRGLLR